MEGLIPTHSADVTLQRVGKEAILYDQRHGHAHVINSSAARIWDLCDGRATVEQIAQTFAATYGMRASDVYDDVVTILTTFRQLRVID